jgi:hypothetical protein
LLFVPSGSLMISKTFRIPNSLRLILLRRVNKTFWLKGNSVCVSLLD